MKILSVLLLSAVLTMLLFSCQPEVPDLKPDPVDSIPQVDTAFSTRNQLSKTVLTLGSEITTMIHQYDAQGKLSWHSKTSNQSDSLFTEDTSAIVRDAQGMIRQIVYRSDTTKRFRDPAIDTLVYNVFYNSTSKQYTYKILNYLSYKVKFKDSVAYTYNAQSQIVTEEAFYFDYKTTRKYISYAKTNYTYDAKGDITNLNTVYYNIDGKGTDYPFSIAYTYDDKENALNLGTEAIVLGMDEGWSGHNVLTMVGTFPKDPQYNQSLTYVYKYNSKNRPLSATVTDAVSGAKGTKVFTYQ